MSIFRIPDTDRSAFIATRAAAPPRPNVFRAPPGGLTTAQGTIGAPHPPPVAPVAKAAGRCPTCEKPTRRKLRKKLDL